MNSGPPFFRTLSILLLILVAFLIACAPQDCVNAQDHYRCVKSLEESLKENNRLRADQAEQECTLLQLKANLSRQDFDRNTCIEQAKQELSAREQPHPALRIDIEDVVIDNDYVLLDVAGVQAGMLADTNSMDPLLDEDNIVLEVVPEQTADIYLGDIIIYESQVVDARVIHRVVQIGKDKEGWFAITRGDNLAENDPERVRWEQVKGVVVGIIY